MIFQCMHVHLWQNALVKDNWILNLLCSFVLSSLMWSCLSNGYVNKQIPNYPLWNKVIECSKKISSLYTLRLFIETCYVQIHCFGMEQNSISPEWEAMNIASELCYAQALVSLNGALYQLAISIKWACLMWIHVHVCAWERVRWCMSGGKDRALIYVDKWWLLDFPCLSLWSHLCCFWKKDASCLNDLEANFKQVNEK